MQPVLGIANPPPAQQGLLQLTPSPSPEHPSAQPRTPLRAPFPQYTHYLSRSRWARKGSGTCLQVTGLEGPPNRTGVALEGNGGVGQGHTHIRNGSPSPASGDLQGHSTIFVSLSHAPHPSCFPPAHAARLCTQWSALCVTHTHIHTATPESPARHPPETPSLLFPFFGGLAPLPTHTHSPSWGAPHSLLVGELPLAWASLSLSRHRPWPGEVGVLQCGSGGGWRQLLSPGAQLWHLSRSDSDSGTSRLGPMAPLASLFLCSGAAATPPSLPLSLPPASLSPPPLPGLCREGLGAFVFQFFARSGQGGRGRRWPELLDLERQTGDRCLPPGWDGFPAQATKLVSQRDKVNLGGAQPPPRASTPVGSFLFP